MDRRFSAVYCGELQFENQYFKEETFNDWVMGFALFFSETAFI
jgi:hypothetical protein